MLLVPIFLSNPNLKAQNYGLLRASLLGLFSTRGTRYFKHENIWIKTRSKKIKATIYVLSSSKSSLNQKSLKCWIQNNIKIDMNFDDYYKSILG